MVDKRPQPAGDTGTRNYLPNRKADVLNVAHAYTGIINIYELIKKGEPAEKTTPLTTSKREEKRVAKEQRKVEPKALRYKFAYSKNKRGLALHEIYIGPTGTEEFRSVPMKDYDKILSAHNLDSGRAPSMGELDHLYKVDTGKARGKLENSIFNIAEKHQTSISTIKTIYERYKEDREKKSRVSTTTESIEKAAEKLKVSPTSSRKSEQKLPLKVIEYINNKNIENVDPSVIDDQYTRIPAEHVEKALPSNLENIKYTIDSNGNVKAFYRFSKRIEYRKKITKKVMPKRSGSRSKFMKKCILKNIRGKMKRVCSKRRR